MLQRAIAWAVRMALGLIAPGPAPGARARGDARFGPGSRVRFSLFPLALAAYDPFVWTCLWNGIVLAAAVSIGSVFIGVPAGLDPGARRFWTRPILAALIDRPGGRFPGFPGPRLARALRSVGPPIWQRLVDESRPLGGIPGPDLALADLGLVGAGAGSGAGRDRDDQLP